MTTYELERTYEITIDNGGKVEQELLKLEVPFGDLLDSITRMADAGDLGQLYLIKGTKIGDPRKVDYWWDSAEWADLALETVYGPVNYSVRETKITF